MDRTIKTLVKLIDDTENRITRAIEAKRWVLADQQTYYQSGLEVALAIVRGEG